MNVEIRAYEENDLRYMIEIWNEVVREGNAFPQEKSLDSLTGKEFFDSQTYAAVAVYDKEICGLYILHPNNIGRCGHICNASYAVISGRRGLKIGEKLVLDSLIQGKRFGFKILQFNAVVAANISARCLYERLGFIRLGTIRKGFRLEDGRYEDICPYYKEL